MNVIQKITNFYDFIKRQSFFGFRARRVAMIIGLEKYGLLIDSNLYPAV